jgi:hypothetical protein
MSMKPVRRAAFHRPLSTLASMSLLFVLSGCISPQLDRPAALRDYENARSCCTSFSGAKAESLPFGSETPFQIDQRDQAFNFGNDGISFFKLYTLPEESLPYVCRIVSHASGDGRALNVFFPKVALLDGQFSIMEDLTSESPRGAGPASSKMGGAPPSTIPAVEAVIMNDTGAVHFLGSPISLENNMDVFCNLQN